MEDAEETNNTSIINNIRTTIDVIVNMLRYSVLQLLELKQLVLVHTYAHLYDSLQVFHSLHSSHCRPFPF